MKIGRLVLFSTILWGAMGDSLAFSQNPPGQQPPPASRWVSPRTLSFQTLPLSIDIPSGWQQTAERLDYDRPRVDVVNSQQKYILAIFKPTAEQFENEWQSYRALHREDPTVLLRQLTIDGSKAESYLFVDEDPRTIYWYIFVPARHVKLLAVARTPGQREKEFERDFKTLLQQIHWKLKTPKEGGPHE